MDTTKLWGFEYASSFHSLSYIKLGAYQIPRYQGLKRIACLGMKKYLHYYFARQGSDIVNESDILSTFKPNRWVAAGDSPLITNILGCI